MTGDSGLFHGTKGFYDTPLSHYRQSRLQYSILTYMSEYTIFLITKDNRGGAKMSCLSPVLSLIGTLIFLGILHKIGKKL